MVFEIGSEFDFDFDSIMSQTQKEMDDFLGYENYKLISSGRCGIKQVLMNLISENDGKDEYLLPSYLCPSIVQPFIELNLKIIYYHVKPDLSIDLEDLQTKITKKTKAVYFIHYFGIQQPEQVLTLLMTIKEENISLIEDITHNFFSKRADIGDYLIASLRKWAPLPHGGLVIVNRKPAEYKTFYVTPNFALRIGQLRAFGQQLKYKYIHGLKDKNVKQEYLKIIRDMDQALYSHIEMAPMDELSRNMVMRMDFEQLAAKRRSNYKFLYNHLKGINEIKIVVGDIGETVTPLGLQISFEYRDDLRNYLVKNGVYASIHWILPPEVQKNFKEAVFISQRILTIPCDQRYGEEEMEYIVRLFRNYFSEKETRNLSSLKVGEGV